MPNPSCRMQKRGELVSQPLVIFPPPGSSPDDLCCLVLAQFQEDIGRISTATGVTSGKWTIWQPATNIDEKWGSLARALVGPGGSLASSSARTAKIQSSMKEDDKYELSVGCDDSFDQVKMKTVLRELLKLDMQPVSYTVRLQLFLQVGEC